MEEKTEIRWKQRFDNFSKVFACDVVRDIVLRYHPMLDETLKDLEARL